MGNFLVEQVMESLPNFDGVSISVQDFIRDCKRAAEILKDFEDEFIVKLLQIKVTGQAKLLISNKCFLTVQSFYSYLKRIFAPSTDIFSLLASLNDVYQKEDERVLFYSARVKDLADEIFDENKGIFDDRLLRKQINEKYVEGLRQEIRKELMHMIKDASDFDTLMVRAINMEHSIEVINFLRNKCSANANERFKQTEDSVILEQRSKKVTSDSNVFENYFDCNTNIVVKHKANQDQEVNNLNSQNKVQDTLQIHNLNYFYRECYSEDNYNKSINCYAERDTTLGGAKDAPKAIPSENKNCSNENEIALSEIEDLLGSNEHSSDYLLDNVDIGTLISFNDEKCSEELENLMSFEYKNIFVNLTSFELCEKEIINDNNELKNEFNEPNDLIMLEDDNDYPQIKDSNVSSKCNENEDFSIFDESCDNTKSQDNLNQLSKVLKQKLDWLKWQDINEQYTQKCENGLDFDNKVHITLSSADSGSFICKRSEEKDHNFFVIEPT